MVNAPQVFNTSSHGFLGSVSLIVMLGSYGLLFYIFPHFREKIQTLIKGNKEATLPVESPESTEESKKIRKEIDNFDLSFFEE